MPRVVKVIRRGRRSGGDGTGSSGGDGTGSGEGGGTPGSGTRGGERPRRGGHSRTGSGRRDGQQRTGGQSRGGSGGRGGRPERKPKPPWQLPKWKRRKMMDPAKLERQEEAKKLAKRRGIPLVQAHRILQGETTLNEVLKDLVKKSRFERLVNVEGMEPSLAGQVAAGNLSVERARIIAEVRKFRVEPIDHDAIKVAAGAKHEVSICLFEGDWLQGQVVSARTYDFEFLPVGDGAEVQTIDKHMVKILAVSPAADVEPALGTNARVKKLGLAASEDQEDRLRPEMTKLLKLVKAETDIKVTLRDGVVVKGKVTSFGRWDLELTTDDCPPVTVFFHALHPTNARTLT